MRYFGEWKPDIAPFENTDGLRTCTNVIPGSTEYRPFPSAVLSSSTGVITGVVTGGYAVRSLSQTGVTYNFIGTISALYLSSATNFTDVSIAGGYSGTTYEDRWDFAQVGNEVLATNFLDPIQTYTIESSSLFANLGGSPPHARTMARVGDFLVVGNTWDGATNYYPQRVQWAGIGTTTSWTVSATTQADYQDLNNEFGWIQRVIGGQYGGLIFQQYGIVRMTYIGSPLIFQFDIVNDAIGALTPSSVINTGDVVAFLSQNGFYILDGQNSIPIGDKKVDTFFFDDYDPVYLPTMNAILYPESSVICWSYRSTSTSGNYNDRLLMYNYNPESRHRWTLVNLDHEFVFLTLSTSWTLDTLDVYPNGTTIYNLDTLPYSLDSPEYIGDQQVFGALVADDVSAETASVYKLTGPPLTPNLITGEFQIEEGKRGMITRIRPYVNYDSVLTGNPGWGATTSSTASIGYGVPQVYISSRDILNKTATWTGAINLTANGEATSRKTGRYFSLRFTLTYGNFTGYDGYDLLSAVEEGER